MIKEFNSSNKSFPFLSHLYDKPILFVEELAILEGISSSKNFYGYYDTENFNNFLLISEQVDGSKTCFFYPEIANWDELNLKRLLNGKTYIQTNLIGKNIITSSDIPVINPHVVVYFYFNSNLKLDFEHKDNFRANIKENVVLGKLKSIDINFYNDNEHIAYCGSNLINSKTAMIGIEVDPKWRQQGIGKLILSEVITKLHDHNIEPVYACDKSNMPSFQLALNYFTPFWEYHCMFLNDWKLNRPSNEAQILPDSLFMK